jgi:hypothetical protein
VKSGSGSAIAFGRVLQAVRKRSSKNQADVAGSFDPKLSVAAVSMAESGHRPPKTEAIVRGYAAAVELDEDALVELWWAMQGLVADELHGESSSPTWWRELWCSPQVELVHRQAVADAARVWTPNGDWYPPSLELVALADAICDILRRRLLGDSWKVGYRTEIGLRDPVEGHLASVIIELRAADPHEVGSNGPLELLATFVCPEPVAPPAPPEPTPRPTGAIAPDVAWILAAVESMPARERAAVAGFIHGLREGASLFSDVARPPT